MTRVSRTCCRQPSPMNASIHTKQLNAAGTVTPAQCVLRMGKDDITWGLRDLSHCEHTSGACTNEEGSTGPPSASIVSLRRMV
ncbi:hypothetical protein NDU88_002822 [Pleurodeles waltl]|uniref:Uncharacterized protein n=1 Tax=Pleurodeles waltl TaxID=8319 RepID=A0AAV7UWP2_PLEWA|nr:hypothetical protein NDU88_002822 [Pleurodeles waltl]